MALRWGQPCLVPVTQFRYSQTIILEQTSATRLLVPLSTREFVPRLTQQSLFFSTFKKPQEDSDNLTLGPPTTSPSRFAFPESILRAIGVVGCFFVRALNLHERTAPVAENEKQSSSRILRDVCWNTLKFAFGMEIATIKTAVAAY